MSGHRMPQEADALYRGALVQVQPGTALWHAGARFGEVVALRARKRRRQTTSVLVRLDLGHKVWLGAETVLGA